MAVPILDLSIFEYFSPILTFILVWTLVFGIFQYAKIFGDNRVIHGMIAFIIGIFFLFVGEAATIVNFMAPWFTVLFIFAIFVLIIFKIFGATDAQIKNVITHHGGLRWVIIIMAIIILLISFAVAFGQQWLGYTEPYTAEQGVPSNQQTTGELSSSNGGDYYSNVAGTLFHPKILGVLFLLIIAVFTIKALGDPMAKLWPPGR